MIQSMQAIRMDSGLEFRQRRADGCSYSCVFPQWLSSWLRIILLSFCEKRSG